MSRILTARGLRYTYPDGTLALDTVDFDLDRGESVALLGPNGSGKTTFVLRLAGLLTGEGSVQCDSRIGLVFQDPDEQLFMPTVLEDVCFGPLNLGMDREAAVQRAQNALRQTGMIHAMGKAPYHLSAGEKRRVAVAGVLAMDPEILILDEPTTFLDPPGQRDLIRLLNDLPQAKIVITHNLALARAIAGRAVFMEHGKIAGDGPVDDLIRRFDWEVGSPQSVSPDHR